jgi:hypothetical protein
MNGTRDKDETATTDEGKLDPREAAELLEQTTRRAQRQLEVRTPLLMLIGAAVLVFAYGVLWLSVRNQHPYSGPSGTALAVMYTSLIGWVVVVATFTRRARSGVGGRSSRQQGIEGAVFATIWTSVYVFQGALHHAGAGHAIAYGIYPAVAPLIIVGSAAAAHAAAREDWRSLSFAIAAVVLGALAAFAGPAGVWGVVGIGLGVLLLGYAATMVWQQRA